MIPVKLQELLDYKGETVTNKQAAEVGISRERLRLLANAGCLERVAVGIYISPDALPDKMYVEQLRKPKIIFSHETALFFHDLTDRDPLSYSVTVPQGYNTSALVSESINVFTVKQEFYELGTVQMKTAFGHNVRTYCLERTICDCIRSRGRMDIAIVTDAIKRYVKRKDKNINLLMKYAKSFRITKTLRSYMEVLL
ncbi:MAG: type IV toxin-antitoxin system AbiEi family antitoxin domain-containing protein [Fibromonadaceae bacterium]|jgi:predicted transcriptional regulator of viral defense system|nr:type IV toxin-antitoxin system AbiEi family antitoxin domain-containing protein [Fibromonadaceae bacterium]